MGKLDKEEFVCIDCETTGLDTEKDRIIEVAAVRFTLNKIFDQFESLFDPERNIPDSSVAIHHITNDMVKDKPTIEHILPTILKFIGKHTIVGHGVEFDIELIANAADRARIPSTIRENPRLDTLRMARLYGRSPINSLEGLRKHFNIEYEGPHRAMSDVIVNVEVFKQLAKPFDTTEKLFKTLSRPIAMKTMPLGKHKGRPIREVPIPYLKWAANKDFDQDLLFTIRQEINRRKSGDLFHQSTNPFHKL